MYPLMLEGSALRALVVGGGEVALRKIRALVDSGATVRVIALEINEPLRALAARIALEQRAYAAPDIGDAVLVVAATSSREVNARVAHDAKALGRLVNVVDAPSEGNCVTPATHRAGDLVVAVAAGGVPLAAARIRDAIAARYGNAYAEAIARLSAVRTELLAAGQRERWAAVSGEAIGPDFCESVEHGAFLARADAWR